MATLNKNIFTVCTENNGFSRVYTSGKFFELSEGKVNIVNPTLLENTLAWVLENFNVNPEGFHFYYDIKANSIKHIVESVSSELQGEQLNESVKSHDEIVELKENLDELKQLRKVHKLSNHEVAVNEANEMIKKVEERIEQLKKTATYVKYTYVTEGNKSYINNREVSTNDFAEIAFATGHVSYSNKRLLEVFEIAAKNFKHFGTLENLVEITEGNVSISVFRSKDKGYTFRNNRENKIVEFKEWSPIGAIDYVVERTGEDLSYMFEDLLESKEQLKAKIDARIEETYGLIAFLKDQKNVLAEANRNILEIKEADSLISSEIAKFYKIISILENDELTKNDGYMDAKLAVEYKGKQEGTEVKVDALDYTSSAKDDMITVLVGQEPIKVLKRHIDLNSGDSI